MKKKKITGMLLVASFIVSVFVPTVSAAAKQETVYVITKKSEQYRTDPAYTTDYTYTANGLLKAFPSIMDDTISFSYKNGRIVKRTMSGHLSKEDTNYTENCEYNYGKNGNIKNAKLDYQEIIMSTNENHSGWEKFSANYNKNSMLEGLVYNESIGSNNGDKYNFLYDKAGNITKMTKLYKLQNGSYETSYMKSYIYDKKGNMKKIKSEKYGVVSTYKNTYDKNGNLVKKSDGNKVTTYQYKRIKVSAKYADAIREQQWEIVNPYFSIYLGWNLEKEFEL